MEGFAKGYYEGALAAAQEMAVLRNPAQVAEKIYAERPRFSRESSSYAQEITRFYQRYSDLRQASLGWLIYELRDGGTGINEPEIRRRVWQSNNP